MSDKPLPSGRMRDELVRLSIRTLVKANGNEHVERKLGVRMSVGLRECVARSNPYAYRSPHEKRVANARVRMDAGLRECGSTRFAR